MKNFVLFLITLPIFGASVSVRPTSSEALLTLRGGNGQACTWKVSLVNDFSGAYAPINDVNTTLFTGSDQDTRDNWSIATGSDRIFRLGHRGWAWLASDNKRYARVLEPSTQYFYQVSVCVSSPITGSFTTQNITFGNTRGNPYPVDPASPSVLAEPSAPLIRNASVQDPWTGAKITAITAPGDRLYNAVTTTLTSVNASAYAIDTNWATPSGPLTGGSATYTGTGSGTPDILFLRLNSFLLPSTSQAQGTESNNPSTDFLYYQVTIPSAAASGGTCASSNTNLECGIYVCLVMDGAHAIPESCKLSYLTNAPASITVGTGSNNDIWTTEPRHHSQIVTPGIGTMTIAAGGLQVTLATSGGRFPETLNSGSRLRVTVGSNVADCKVASFPDAFTAILVDATCWAGASPSSIDVTNQQTATSWAAPNVGFGIYKANNTANTITIGNGISQTVQGSVQMFTSQNGIITPFSTKTSDGYYNAFFKSSGSTGAWYSINASTGQSNLIGKTQLPVKNTGFNKWATSTFEMVSVGNAFLQNAPDTFLGMGLDANSKWFAYTVQYTGNHSGVSNLNEVTAKIGTGCSNTGDYAQTCTSPDGSGQVIITDLTPSFDGSGVATGTTLQDQIAAFTVNDVYPYKPNDANNPLLTCQTEGVQMHYLMILCWSSFGQGTGGVWAVFDVGDGNPAHAGQVGGPSVIAATSTFNAFPMRWGCNHGVYFPGHVPYLIPNVSYCSNALTSASAPLAGPYIMGVIGNIPATSGVITVDLDISSTYMQDANGNAEPYDPNPQTKDCNLGLGAGTAGCVAKLKPGDIMMFSTSSTNATASLSKPMYQYLGRVGPTQIQIQIVNGVIAASTGPGYLHMSVDTNMNFSRLTGAITSQAPLWDFIADPHGNNAGYNIHSDPFANNPTTNTIVEYSGLTVSHGIQRQDTVTGYSTIFEQNSAANVTPNPSCKDSTWSCMAGYFATTGFDGSLTNTQYEILQAGLFAGKNPGKHVIANFPTQTHYSQFTWSPLPLLTDNHPFIGSTPGTGVYTATRVTGDLWKISTGTSTPDTNTINGDTLYWKLYDVQGICGTRPCLDISSPSTGDLITGTYSDNGKMCHVRKAGECRSASAPGEIYFNSYMTANVSGNASTISPCTNTGSSFSAGQLFAGGQVCFINSFGLWRSQAEATRIDRQDYTGVGSFSYTGGLIGPGYQQATSSSQATPGGEYLIWACTACGYQRNMDHIAAVKAYPYILDSVAKHHFIPATITLPAPPIGQGITRANIQMGYAEYGGDPTKFYCSWYRSACNFASSTFNEDSSTIYTYSNDAPQGVACTGGCNIVLPLKYGGIAYYRTQWMDSLGNVIQTGPIQIITGQ